MKILALPTEAGAYEIRQTDEAIFGGIYINAKNRGVGFVGNTEENRYIFEFEEGMFSKSVRIFYQRKDNPFGKVSLGFTDTGTLEFDDKKYEWQTLGSSKIWLDVGKNITILFDLENNADKSPKVLSSTNIEAKTREILTLCGLYLTVVEWRAGFTNATLAGMPVKTEGFKAENKTETDNRFQKNWFDVLVEAVDVITD